MKYKELLKQIPLLEFIFLAVSNRVSGVHFPCDVLVKDIQQCNESINNVLAPRIRPFNDFILIDYSYGRSCLKSISKYKFDETSHDKMVIYLLFDRSAVSIEVRYSSLRGQNTGLWSLNLKADVAEWSTLSTEVMAKNKMVRILSKL